MTNEGHPKEKKVDLKKLEELDIYGNTGISEGDAKIPRWLLLTYTILPIWGIVSFAIYWNGSHGWLDRGYWQQLQRAANTTFPSENFDDPEQFEKLDQKMKNP